MKLLPLALLTAALLPGARAHAEGGLVVTPHRVVLEERNREREARVTLSNSGTEKETFRLFFVNYRMSEDGAFETITTPVSPTGEQFADKLFRYSPRQVVLEPGQTQIARLQLRLPPNLPEGEYRSHLVFQGQPKASQAVSSSKGRTRASITTLYGVSIPIIYRKGKTSVEASIEEVRLDAAPDAAEVWLGRTGNASVYGDIKLVWTSAKGERKIVGESNGVSVYTPLARRRVRVPFLVDPKTLRGGTLEVRYTESGDEEKIFAKKAIEIR